MPLSNSRIVWTDTSFPGEIDQLLIDSVKPFQLLHASQRSASNLVGASVDPMLEQAEIAFGQPNAEQLMTLEQLKWVHLTSAGYTAYDREDLKKVFRDRGIILTNSSSVYDEPCAQHVFAMMLAMSRQLPSCGVDQLGNRQWPAANVRASSFLLAKQRVIIFGYGYIAKRLCEMLQPFDMEVVGVRRSPRGDEAIPMLTFDEADAWLGQADHVINILPANDDSQGFFSRKRLSQFKASSLFYNIGRGSTVDQDALVEALNEQRLAGAYLDVTVPEPLPQSHALWTARNCWITPHTAGGFNTEMKQLVEHFKRNLDRYTNGENLLNRVV